MKNNWFEVWCADYDSLIMTAVRNLKADLEAGYNPNGASIKRSREVITEFETRYANGLEKMKGLTRPLKSFSKNTIGKYFYKYDSTSGILSRREQIPGYTPTSDWERLPDPINAD